MSVNDSQSSRLFVYDKQHTTGSVRKAINWLAIESSQGKKTRIVLPTWRQITVGIFTDVIGIKVANFAKKHRYFDITLDNNTFSVQVETCGTLSWGYANDSIVVLWPTQKDIEKIDSQCQPSNILIVPWTPKLAQDLKMKWGFRKLGANEIAATLPNLKEEDDTPLGRALTDLTAVINLSTGLAHPSDKSAFVEMLYILRKGKVQIDPNFAETKLVSLGWPISYAREVGDHIRRFNKGGRFIRKKPAPWHKDILKRWLNG